MAFLPRQTCPMCGDDEYTEQFEAPGLWRLTCTNASNGSEPYTWVTNGQGPFDSTEQDGLTAQLGLYEDLLDVFRNDDPWVEYGIIEYRYALAQPKIYQDLVKQYGHVALGPKRYTASSFIGSAVGRLRRDGNLTQIACQPTGRWSYLPQMNAYSTLPAPTDGKVLSWADFAVAEGFTPDDWPPLAKGPSYG